METENNVQKGWRTREQKETIILQWQQSGKSRKVFCEENQISYNALVSWCKQLKDQKQLAGFSEIKIKESPGLFAQVHLSKGIKIDFYQSLPVEYFQSLIK
jgi:regulatory protein YycH of two-component signal transduction system YycFG